MAQCPVCQAPVLEDFGLITCASCGAQLSVQVDGSIEQVSASEESDEVFGQDEDVAAIEYAAPSFEDDEGPVDFSTPEELPAAEPIPMFDAADAEPEVESQPEGEAPAADMLFDDEPAASPMTAGPSVSASPDLSDIAGFGNSEASSHREGSLRYNVRVAGIDTADVREAFREALTDRKFMWDTDEILRNIRDGEVEIVNVAAVKAHVLITRLRTLPVRVLWEQYAIQQT